MAGSQPAGDSTTDQRSPSPPKYSQPDDARQKPSKYPNYWVRKTRSGHVIMLDDTKGNEQLTIQHRSGTMMQFMPDGALQIATNKGRYDTTFGEHRTKVTGSSDLTASAVSMRAKKGEASGGGDISFTAEKNMDVSASIGFTLATNKLSMAAGEFLHAGAKTMAFNAQDGMKLTSSGHASFSGETDVGVGSEKGSATVVGNQYAGMSSNRGTVIRTSDASGVVQLTNTSGQISMEGNKCYINCNRPPITIQPTPTPPSTPSALPPQVISDAMSMIGAKG